LPKKKTEEVQSIDLTELVNYVNYLGEKLNEIGQTVNSNANVRFGMDYVETEGELGNTKYFHVVTSDVIGNDIPIDTKEFYYKKYGSVPEIPKFDFYAF
jgi:hypothetical protein